MENTKVVFENEYVYIISKEHGVPCQSKDQDDIAQAYKTSHFISRLDQPAAGLLMLAKSPKAANMFSAHFKKGRIQKQYVALVEGTGMPQEGILKDQVLKRGQKSYVEEEAEEKNAVLEFQVNTVLDRYTLVDISIQSGRFHQIRSQLAAAGFPIKGDLKYGAKRSNKEGGIYLCCTSITFPADQTGLPMSLKVHPSEYLLPLWKFYDENKGNF